VIAEDSGLQNPTDITDREGRFSIRVNRSLFKNRREFVVVVPFFGRNTVAVVNINPPPKEYKLGEITRGARYPVIRWTATQRADEGEVGAMQKATEERTGANVRGWLVGSSAATLTLVALAFVALGLYTSPPGLVVAGILAFLVGASVAVALDPSGRRHAPIIAGYIFVVLLAYVMILQRITAPGSQGGPNSLPPPWVKTNAPLEKAL
jgi:hypothetical protein